MYPLDFKFKFQEFNNKTNSQVYISLMLVSGQKSLASEQIKYISATCPVLGNRTRVFHQLKKKKKKKSINLRANIYFFVPFRKPYAWPFCFFNH